MAAEQAHEQGRGGVATDRANRVAGMRQLVAVVALAALSSVPAVSIASAEEGSQFRPPVSGKLGVVATESPAAGRIGRAVLQRGGNAVDAAAATVFALDVARPNSCGVGGGGFMVYRSARGRTAALDFRERAPGAFGARTLVPKGLHKDFTGHLTVGVPGTVAGVRAALKRYGTLSLAQAVSPAERLARRGVRVTPEVSQAAKAEADRLRLFPAARRLYLPQGKPRRPGSRFRQPTLANTFGAIRRTNGRAFYRGVIARRIAVDMRRGVRRKGDRGVLRMRDLARYEAKWRRPVTGSFRGASIAAMPPPTSGGVAVVEMLNILEGFDLEAAGQSSAGASHAIIEAQKIAFADRDEYLADPDFVPQPTRRLTSKAYASLRRGEIDGARAKSFEPGLGPRGKASVDRPRPEQSTTHVSILDRRGNAVALTCTIEQNFGSAVVAPGTGFLLNNELTDFGDPGTANQPRAGKRPRSSMSPLIVSRRGRPIIAAGGAGGSTIIEGTLLTVLNRLEYGLDLAHAVDAERLDAQAAPDDPVVIEDKRFDPAVIDDLERRGHRFDRQGEYGEDFPRIQAAGLRSVLGAVKDAVTDSRSEAGSFAQRPRQRSRRAR